MANENEQPSPMPGVNFTITAEELARAAPEDALDGFTSVDCFDLHQRFEAVWKSADQSKKPIFRLLSGLTNYHFVPESRIEPFRPMMEMGDRRTLVPMDLLPAQIAELAKFAPTVTNHGLRARIADVVWFMDRKQSALGFLAVSSYCDGIEAVSSGAVVLAFEQLSPYDVHAVDLLKRTIAIANSMGWERDEFNRLRALISGLTQSAYNEGDPSGFIRIAEVDLGRKISAPSTLAGWAECLVALDSMADDPDTRQRLWETAARANHIARDDANENRCRILAAECIVEKANLAQASPMTKAAFLQDAIDQLRPVPGTRDRRAELHDELRRVQPGIRDEMGTISHEIDLTEIVEHSRATVAGRSLPRALLELMICDRIPEPADLRAEVIEQQEESPIASIIPMSVHDHQGRVVFTSPGLGDDPQTNEQHYRFLMARHQDMHRKITVAGAIDPIRQVITSEHPVSNNDLISILEDSPFVPPGHEHIFGRGAFRFMGGEDMEAASLLVPQLENSLRHLLALKGIDTTTVDQDGIQTEASLSQLLDRHREQLEQILPPRYVHELDLLFNFRGGPSLRNDLAHGKIAAGAFWDHNMIYGSWLILHLAIVPLLRNWEQIEIKFAARTVLEREG